MSFFLFGVFTGYKDLNRGEGVGEFKEKYGMDELDRAIV